MGGVKGPQACGLFVLGVLLACGNLIHGSQYNGEVYSVRCTIGIQVTSRPPGGGFDACGLLRQGYSSDYVGSCKEIGANEQGAYILYELAINLRNGYSGSRNELIGSWVAAKAESAVYGGRFVPGTFQCYDIDECVDRTNECSGNAACYNDWATYTCKCLSGYKDNSASGSREGYKCDKEGEKPEDSDQVDIQIWVYVLIGVAIFVVLMLLVCCCCCYSGSSDCFPAMHQARTKVIKHIKVVPQPMPIQAPCPPPPCICKPPEEKKIIIQVDQAPTPAPAPVQQVIQPMISGPSAFIANSGYDGQVYIASPQAQPVQEPQAQQVYQYIQQPQVIQQQQQVIQYEQPQYDQQITTPYVINVGGDPSTYYQ